MSWWGGRDQNTDTVRDWFVTFGAFQKVTEMQYNLLTAAGKKCELWFRNLSTTEKCPCNTNNTPLNPHYICYGTGYVGGYSKYGYREWTIYRKSNTILRFFDGTNAYDMTIAGNAVTTNDIVGTNPVIAPMLSDTYGAGMTVKYSIDNTNWTDTLNLPVAKFKIRISNISALFEASRFRVKTTATPWIYLSENPPTRFEQLFKQGLDSTPFDIRTWTIGDFRLYSGDVIKWLEGQYVDQRYTMVNTRPTQFVKDYDEQVADRYSSDLLSQIATMRKVKQSEQLGRIW